MEADLEVGDSGSLSFRAFQARDPLPPLVGAFPQRVEIGSVATADVAGLEGPARAARQRRRVVDERVRNQGRALGAIRRNRMGGVAGRANGGSGTRLATRTNLADRRKRLESASEGDQLAGAGTGPGGLCENPLEISHSGERRAQGFAFAIEFEPVGHRALTTVDRGDVEERVIEPTRQAPGAERAPTDVDPFDQGSPATAVLGVLDEFEMTPGRRVELHGLVEGVGLELRDVIQRVRLVVANEAQNPFDRRPFGRGQGVEVETPGRGRAVGAVRSRHRGAHQLGQTRTQGVVEDGQQRWAARSSRGATRSVSATSASKLSAGTTRSSPVVASRIASAPPAPSHSSEARATSR